VTATVQTLYEHPRVTVRELREPDDPPRSGRLGAASSAGPYPGAKP